MTGGCLKNKFCLLLWKNFLLVKRHWFVTLLEVCIIPLISILLVFLVIQNAPAEDKWDVGAIKAVARYKEYGPMNPSGSKVVDRNSNKTFILWAPNTSTEVTGIMGGVEAHFKAPGKFQDVLSKYVFLSYDDENALVQDYLQNSEFGKTKTTNTELRGWELWGKKEEKDPPLLAAITFSTTSSDEISYRIRFPPGNPGSHGYGEWETNLVFPAQPDNRERSAGAQSGSYPAYWKAGFIFLQSVVDDVIVQQRTVSGQSTRFVVTLNRFPYPEVRIDNSGFLTQLLPISLVQSFMYAVANIAKAIVWEKERRLKESMKMMGLPGWIHWMAWLTKSFILFTLTAALISPSLRIEVKGEAMVTHTDGSVVFIFLLTYVFSVITFGFLVGSFCTKANWATIVACVLFFATYLPYIFVEKRYQMLPARIKIGWSFLNNCGLGMGCKIISLFEGTGAGVQWSTIAQTATPDDNISLLSIMGMLLLDGFIYLFLAMYIEAVLPGEFGVPLPWYFPCVPGYWFRARNKVQPDNSSSTNNTGGFFETEPENAAIGIRIMGLRKVFGKKVAVDGLHLNFYENQVTALLGHNGAGKTTVMSMLTGLYQPRRGTALVNGFDIRTDMQSVRKSLGLCPQHNVLFDDLTVEEHLKFFCLMKGYDQPVKPEIDRMLVAIQLEDKRKARTKTLSGGMKRKLSVGIAFVGGSKVVLLDEPTAGMDPGARRGTWDIISKEKQGRTILLSTHYMDEADLLGDRIAILANGKVACCGSPLFLKQKYGGGYHLIIVKEPNCKVDLITQLLQKYIPEVKVDQNIGTELSYSLPEGKASVFPGMFEELENRKAELAISSYGCSITQMEEVFMRVGQQLDEEMKQKSGQKNGTVHPSTNPTQLSSTNLELTVEPPGSRKSQSEVPIEHEVVTDDGTINNQLVSQLPSGKGIKIDDSPPPILTQPSRKKGFSLFLQQYRAMLVKKWIYTMRSWMFFSILTLLIVILFGLSVWAVMTQIEKFKRGFPAKDPLEMPLDLKRFNEPITTIECFQPSASICEVYEDVAQSQSRVEETGTLKFDDFILEKAGSENNNQPDVNARYIVGLQVEEKTPWRLKGYFNGQPYHAPPIALNFLSTSILRTVTNNSEFKLSVSNYPLPFREDGKVVDTDYYDDIQQKLEPGGPQTVGIVAFLLLTLLSLFVASFIMFPVKERAGQAKHLQFVSGVPYSTFWLAHLTFDGLFYIFICILMVVAVIIFPVEPLDTGRAYFLLFLILLCYGWAVMPLTYLFSLLFANHSTGCTVVFVLYVLLGYGFGKLSLLGNFFFDLLPSGGLLSSIVTLGISLQWCQGCGIGDVLRYQFINPLTPDDTSFTRLGTRLLFLFIGGLIYFGILCLLESNVLRRFGCRFWTRKPVLNAEDPAMMEDSDVAAENQRIRGTDLNQLFVIDNMVLKDLTKRYKNFLAVDRVCLGVQHGECFGLLGVNGAGKTSTFRMLTGDTPVTSGDAYITGNSVKTKIKEVYKKIGYCPQFDALIPELTGKEKIRMFARLRGIPESEINGLIDQLSTDLLFAEHISKPCGTYSGGNKRKLSAAIALIGNPTMVFLDEPTAGMDPLARRHLWNTVIKVREGGVSVILTSHSMDECEALCTRLAIMVNGKFRCLGSTQHLKNKFGDGYTIIAQLPAAPYEPPEQNRSSLDKGSKRQSSDRQAEPWEAHLQPLRDFIESNFNGCELKDKHPCYVHYHIHMNPAISWPLLFGKMEEAKNLFNLEAYSVGQTSLEQVFLGFTKAQFNVETEISLV